MNRHYLICITLSLILTGCGGASSSEEDETMTPDISIDDECNTRNATSTVASFAAALLSTAMLAGCSDGDSDSGHTVSGTLFTAGQTVIDYDINDAYSGSQTNSTPFEAQPLPNVVTVQGFASDIPTNAAVTDDPDFERFANEADKYDYYSVSLQAGQRILMNVVDYYGNDNPDNPYAGDLDLILFSNTSLDTIVRASESQTSKEEIQVPADGEYILEVFAYSGISKYVLQILPSDSVILAGNRQPEVENKQLFKTNEAIVKWKSGGPKSGTATVTSRGYRVTMQGNQNNLPEKVTFQPPAKPLNNSTASSTASAARDTLMTIKELRQRPDVEYAEPNFIRRAMLQPNDDLYRWQYHYDDIRLPQAWDLTKGSSEVIVAVIDTGVYLEHTDLSGKLITGYDFLDDDTDPDDPGDNPTGASTWHGTHVTGTVAAQTDNNRGVAGSGWNTRVMPLRVLGSGGGETADVIQAIYYASGLPNRSNQLPSKKADIINLSLGGGGRSTAEQEAINAAREAGVIVVAAAGNSGSDELFYPASYDGVVSVSAVGPDKERPRYSNFGDSIDMAAPGGNLDIDLNSDGEADGVYSTIAIEDSNTGSRSSGYGLLEGTSMAAPHVSGVIALMRAVYPDLSPSDLDTLIASGAITDDIGEAGRDQYFGFGLINALKAIQAADDLFEGGSLPVIPVLEAAPAALQFGSGSSLTLTLDNVNSEAADPSITTDVSEDWLSVSPTDVDTNGFGEYRVTIDRTDLVDGIYEGLIRFTPDTGNSLDVTVTMRVGDIVAITDSAPQYVLLEDSETAEIVAETLVNPDGSYAVTDVPAGSYRIIAGSDIDVDLFICQNGETCGGYPDSVTEEVVVVDGDVTDIDFVVSLISGIDVSDDGGLGVLRANPSTGHEEPEPADSSTKDENDNKPVRSVSR